MRLGSASRSIERQEGLNLGGEPDDAFRDDEDAALSTHVGLGQAHEQAWLHRLLTLVDQAAADDSKVRRVIGTTWARRTRAGRRLYRVPASRSRPCAGRSGRSRWSRRCTAGKRLTNAGRRSNASSAARRTCWSRRTSRGRASICKTAYSMGGQPGTAVEPCPSGAARRAGRSHRSNQTCPRDAPRVPASDRIRTAHSGREACDPLGKRDGGQPRRCGVADRVGPRRGNSLLTESDPSPARVDPRSPSTTHGGATRDGWRGSCAGGASGPPSGRGRIRP